MRLFLLAGALISTPALAEAPAPTAPLPPAAVAMIGPTLHVTDIGKSLRFYTEGLGLKLQMQMGPENRREYMVGFGSDPRQPAFILLGNSTKTAPKRVTHGTGFDRLVMRVRSIAEVVARLRSMGYTVGDVREVAMGYRMAMAADPDGYRLELVESAARPEKLNDPHPP